MSNGTSVLERLFRLWAKIAMMVVDGARQAEDVARFLQRIVEKPDFVSILDTPPRAASVSTEPVGGWAAEWTQFYREVFGMEVNLAGVVIPEGQPGFGWVVMIAQNLSLNQAWEVCKRLFPCNSYIGDGLDRAVPTNDRTSGAAYARRFRNRVEADKENKNMSANSLAKQAVQGITLLERIVLELWYFWKTGGGHLDLVNLTLCTGSRDSDGRVPRADWSDSRFRLRWCPPDHAHDDIRARSAV